MEEVMVEKATEVLPKLRFPQYAGPWKKGPIGKHIEFVSGVALPGNEISEVKGGVAILRGINITEGSVRHSPDIDRYYHGSLDGIDHLLLKEGDLVLGMDGSKVGKNTAVISKDDEGSLLIQRVARIRPTGTASIDFIYHHIFSYRFHDYVDVVNTSSGIPHISGKQIRDFEVAFPTLPEQQKIAAFLGAVDRKIQQLKRKQALLEQYKKGVVQQLFSQELRFKRKEGAPSRGASATKGGEFPEWEEKTLGDIYTYHNTNSLSRDKLNYEGGDVLNIHYGDIHTKFAAIFKVENERVPYINDDVDLSRVSEDQYCQPCDLVIADASEDLNDIGKTIEIASTGGKRIVAGLHTYLARPKKGSMAPGYGAYLMRSEQVREEIERLAHGTKVMSISRTHLNSIMVSLPSLEEQSRIAGFLMALDAKVAGVAQAVAAAQKWKKGLLQQMFV